MQDAPLYDEADGPEGGRAYWLTCADGVQVRMGWWPAEAAKGTILFFPGRTEYIEKYGRAAREYVAAGWNMAAMDWRGQGLADRALKDPATGHVDEFADYQLDVDAMVEAVTALEGGPLPRVLIGHSMGGCIGLRAAQRLDLKAAAFSAPMWGIRFHPAVRPAAWLLSALSRPLGMGGRYAPGTQPETYALAAEFAGNMLTRDEEMWLYMRAQLTAHPELALGGPSLHWLNRALVEMRALLRAPAPDLPCLTYLGGNERIVDPAAVRTRMATWPGAELVEPEGAEHEILMETPDVRDAFFARTIAFFNTHAGVPASVNP
ncbi:alpha/beta fold hydrolase [Vannielia sp. SX4]|uniref:alpha/beta fold hydrolase n=1 Tax=Vannielia sp. SX4 TaxID=3463852 RepID=UPI004058750B